MWFIKGKSTGTSAQSVMTSPLSSQEYEDVLKRISSLKADVLELQSAQEKQRERLLSLAGKLYATAALEKQAEAKDIKPTEPGFL